MVSHPFRESCLHASLKTGTRVRRNRCPSPSRAEPSTAPDRLQPTLLRRFGFRRQVSASVRWPARRVVGGVLCPSARGCAGGAIGTEAVPAVGGLRDSAGAPWERGDVARTSALPPPNNALERTGHSGHPWPAWGCPCGPPLTASVRRLSKHKFSANK